jgi:hypothetical protein
MGLRSEHAIGLGLAVIAMSEDDEPFLRAAAEVVARDAEGRMLHADDERTLADVDWLTPADAERLCALLAYRFDNGDEAIDDDDRRSYDRLETYARERNPAGVPHPDAAVRPGN